MTAEAELEARKTTPSVEDYLETIYQLIRKKGYARTIDISKMLRVRPPSVTKMIQHMHGMKLLFYEKYRGITLTPKGERVARSVRQRHETVLRFLLMLDIDEETALTDAEGIEHHLHPLTLSRIERFVRLAEEKPEWFRKLKDHIRKK